MRCLAVMCVLVGNAVAIEAEPIENEVRHIDFRRQGEGSGLILVDLSHSQAIVNVTRRNRQLEVDILNTKLPSELLYILDVTDFATVVRQIETFSEPENTRIVVDAQGDFDYDYRIDGSQLKLQVIKRVVVENNDDEVPYTSKPISINFQDIPVRNVLQLVADYNDFNLVVSDSVQGNVTLRLDGVPWEQVLDMILDVRGLEKRVEGNVVLIAPRTEFAESDRIEMEAQRLEEELLPLDTRLYQLNYAKAEDIASLFESSAEGISLLSARGAVSVDARTNTLIVRDLPEQHFVIADMIDELDVAIRQVQIEARIVTVDEGDLSELGVRWGMFNKNGSYSNGATIDGNASYNTDGEIEIDDYLNVNLGATDGRASSIAFTVAKLGKDLFLDLELSALQAENKAEIVSSPRLLTADKTPAYIEQGTEIPYTESSEGGATTIAFQKAVLSLSVIPQITPDNRLILDLEVTQDAPGDTVKTGTGEALAINTRRLTTQVMVDDGETVVLGGIFQHSTIKTSDKVPLLGDLPGLGMLFRRDGERIQKREMLIFVTPQIVQR
uniref:type IV pilus secretin PilQ n=1 Tax=Thaumasiovibrio occultus TaxID=1891184 RepID=UPI000B357F13|nr:type IV pilus secretin PilQ family protein [Thaumasiovibrio occultus]